MEDLGAEAAAHIGGDDAQLALRDLQDEGAHQKPDDMGILRGGVERVLPGRPIEFGDRGAGLHGIGDETLVDQVDLGDMGRLGEGRIHGALVAEMPVVAEIALGLGPDLRRVGLQRIGRIDRGLQLLIVDRDQLGRVAGLGSGLGDDDGDMIADMAHEIGHQRRMRRLDHGRAVLAVDLPAAGKPALAVGGVVGAGEDGDDPGGLLCLARVDASDLRRGVGRAQDIGMGLTMPVDVVGIGSAAGEEAEILFALDGGADALLIHGQLLIARTPACTALTML